jgi:hypothetical protein
MKKTDLLQGTLDLLVLRALALGPLHGLGVSNRITQITQGVFQVNLARFFPRCTAWRRRAGSHPNGVNPRTTAGPSITA